MELNDYNYEEAAEIGAELEILEEGTGKPTGFVIHLAGKDSDRFRKKERELEQRRYSNMARYGKNARIDLDAEKNELLATCVISWDGLKVGGVNQEASYKYAVELFDKKRWIRDQVDDFIGSRANFFTKG